MASSEIVKEFLAQLEPDEVPFEYISSACIRDVNGQEIVLKGEKLKMLMTNHPDYSYVQDAKVFINVQKVMRAIMTEVEFIYEMVDLMFYRDSIESDNDDSI
jgi:hypothetical protein